MVYINLCPFLLSLVILASSDNLVESRLEGSTTNKEAINVLHADQLASVGISDGTTIKDSNFVGSLLGDISGEPFTDLGVGLLGDLGGGSQTSTNGPDGLVGNNNL